MLAKIAIRSNTQSAVNSRNLRALDGPQLRLQAEFGARFPDVTYETRPDASLTQADSVIQNHQAAKCLCAVMNRRPWLAVKSLSLFEEPHYADIFNDEVHAEQVMLSTRVKQMVDDDSGAVPGHVPALLGTHVNHRDVSSCGSIACASKTRRSDHVCTSVGLRMKTCIRRMLQIALDAARKTLELRCDGKQQEGAVDDFKVDFKNEQVLH